jgi:hypothetical protein
MLQSQRRTQRVSPQFIPRCLGVTYDFVLLSYFTLMTKLFISETRSMQIPNENQFPFNATVCMSTLVGVMNK